MNMERKDFLRGIGLAGAVSLIPFRKVLAGIGAAPEAAAKPTSCTLIPSETAGPFPLDLSANTTYFRQDVREDRVGVQLNLKLKISGLENCAAMPNLRVNIWHCDKDGIYSGYDNAMNAGSTTATYLRGYQMTDANGIVEFITIFPGWYSGRLCHIHFQVYVSTAYAAVSQLTFDISAKNALYAANASIYTKGADPMTVATDNVFSDGVSYQTATLTPNTTTGGYDAYLEATIQGSGTTGIGHIEKENAKNFSLGQNYPNPYKGSTTIPFTLVGKGDVRIELFDLSGRKVGLLEQDNMSIGDHTMELNLSKMNLAHGNYIYQFSVTNSNGVFRESKMMTAL
jgi:protocatechuate 3,4-dioxygenase beta subunit